MNYVTEKNGIVLVIPVYNPTENFEEAIRLTLCYFYKVVVVNDGCSTEYHTAFMRLKKQKDIIVLEHNENKGKGRALKTAFKYILDSLPECKGVVTADADGQHKIKDIVAVEEALLEAESSQTIVLGSRYFDKDVVPLKSKVGNIVTRVILKYLCDLNLVDTQTGLRGIPVELLERELEVVGERYEYETNVLLDAADAGIEFIEVPIETIYEDGNNVSHFSPLRDSIRIYRNILMYSGSSLLSSLLDYSIFMILYPITKNLWIATYAGRGCSAAVNFAINRKAVFKDNNNIMSSLSKYIVLLVLSGTTSALLLQFSAFILGDVYLITKILIEICLYFLNFYIQKNFIFRKK